MFKGDAVVLRDPTTLRWPKLRRTAATKALGWANTRDWFWRGEEEGGVPVCQERKKVGMWVCMSCERAYRRDEQVKEHKGDRVLISTSLDLRAVHIERGDKGQGS